jgi:hypothetical protein
MGNAAIEPAGEDEGQHCEQENPKNDTESSPKDESPSVVKSEAKVIGNSPSISEKKDPPTSEKEKKIEPSEKKSSSTTNRTKKKVEEMKQEEPEEEVDAMDVLFQFIPFYGQGDISHDSIVRSTLSGLPIEDIDHRDEYGNTLLLVACQYRCEAIVRILLNKGADPNAINTSGASPLHFACYKETMSKSIAKLLLQNGANPEVNETTYGCTPLHYCAGTGDTDFCKMLISYGAHISTYDYYNYTCVDYAREAGMNDTAMFLQKKMLMTASQGPGAFVTTKNGSNIVFGKSDGVVSSHQTAISTGLGGGGGNGSGGSSEWIECLDNSTGSRYFMDPSTGECLWENDYFRKMGSLNQNDLQRVNSAMLLDSNTDLLGEAPPPAAPAPVASAASAPDPTRTKLVVETTSAVDSATSPMKMTASMRDMTTMASASAYGPPSVDPNAMKKLLEEAKLQSDDILEQERLKFQTKIAEREGKIAKLESENQTLLREKERIESDLEEARHKYTATSTSGDEALLETQRVIAQLEEENNLLKIELKQTQGTLVREQDKLKSLEATLKNLESGHEERILVEQQAAEERWKQQQEIELQHENALREAEDRYNENKLKLQNELNETKGDYHRHVRETDERLVLVKKDRDKEIEELNSSIAEMKSQFAQELSHAQSLVEVYEKKNKEAQERVEVAEEAQRGMMQEIEEAKMVQKYNAQLHRDLAREQAIRKKLHNEIEDMKGKIRVYVRVRPFSRTELSKGCHEAVVKDGKMSVVVTGGKTPDARKAYDFDSVFSGAMTEGNSQEDIFKDTKHLMMSVIDGYNVCIFAYGQTGSG